MVETSAMNAIHEKGKARMISPTMYPVTIVTMYDSGEEQRIKASPDPAGSGASKMRDVWWLVLPGGKFNIPSARA